MHLVTYSMGIYLTETSSGRTALSTGRPPDEEVFQSHIDELRGVGVHLKG